MALRLPDSLSLTLSFPGITFVCAFSVVEVAFASAVVTGDFDDLMAEFQVGDVVIALSVTLMVCGFGLGPLFWSPVVRGPHFIETPITDTLHAE